MAGDLIGAVVHTLEEHGRVTVGELATLLGVEVEELRRQIEAFNDVELDSQVLDPLFLIEPAAGWPDDGPDPEPRDDDLVGFSPTMTGGDLGLAHTDAATLGPLLAAADQLRSLEPGNLDLAAAVDILRSGLVANVSGSAGYRARTARLLQHSAEHRRAVRVTYARTWRPGLTVRTVHPYRVVSTARGYEVDAGPLDEDGRPRTYLLSGIQDLHVLDEHFDHPAGLDAALEENRRLTAVTGIAPHRVMWAIRHWAERVDQGRSDTEDVTFTAWVLPPVSERVALMCLVAGPQVDLNDPALAEAVRTRATALLAHHGL